MLLQLVELCGILSPQSEYIDWRKFLLLAAQPWPKPTVDQLLKVRNDFVNADLAGNGWITKDQYDNVGTACEVLANTFALALLLIFIHVYVFGF